MASYYNIPSGSIENDVYLGFWINRSLSHLHSATLTMDRRQGGLFIAFLALYVGTIGRSLWKLVRFFLHLVQSKQHSEDGVYHQRQALLRNTPQPMDAILGLAFVNWHWRGRSTGAFRRIAPSILFAVIISGFAIVAGIFSSKIITQTTNEALIKGETCGDIPYNASIPERFGAISVPEVRTPDLSIYHSKKTAEWINYAENCYGEDGSEQKEGCSTFARSKLPYTTSMNASCPWENDEICATKTGNLLLDTGDLNSMEHFGLNSGPRFTMRHRAHCAPLNKQNNFTITFPIPSASNATRTGVNYYYGSSGTHPEDPNLLFQVELVLGGPSWNRIGDYATVMWYASEGKSSFTPIPQLQRPDAMVSLVILDSSSILYKNRTDDPWFGANIEAATDDSAYKEKPYTDQGDLGVMACVTERYYCNPDISLDKDKCVNGYAGANNTADAIARTWPSAEDRAAIRPLLENMYWSAAGWSDMLYYQVGTSTLLSRKTISPETNLQAAALPNNQWQLERIYNWQAGLAAIQSNLVEFSRGFWAGAGKYCSDPSEVSCRRLCSSQKVISPNHYSFSVTPVVLVLVFGGLLFLLSLFIEEIFAFACRIMYRQRERNPGIFGYTEWQANSTMQLQRMAHEAAGSGHWSNGIGSVPVTEVGEKLCLLDISNSQHPRLRQPSAASSPLGSKEEVSVCYTEKPFARPV